MFTALFVDRESWFFWDLSDEFLHQRAMAVQDIQGQFDHVGQPHRRFRATLDECAPGEFFPTYVDVQLTQSEGEEAVQKWVANVRPLLEGIQPEKVSGGRLDNSVGPMLRDGTPLHPR